ncbi:twin-arginine translocase subunit TatC [Desulfosediminicola sp.]|uniref:twin-arginine translocase subunit TatC n=1 Tax=Desulfosediminicola sp. TaxID=2886825 RepID=UPI003AF20AEB
MSDYNLQKTIPALERSLAFFRPHHLELRNRLVKVMAAIVTCSVVAYIFIEQIAQLFISPLIAANPLVGKLVYTNLPEAFVTYIKLALIIGLLASFPVSLYQLWLFVAPGLRKNEKRLAVTVVFWSSILFAGGASFAFLVVLPKMLIYFTSYANEGLEPLPKLGLYLTFVARMILTFGISFQIPFLMVMSGKANLVTASYFRSKRIYFYMAIVFLSFLLAAGDFMATALLALPLFALYEVGIFLSSLFNRKKEQTSEA